MAYENFYATRLTNPITAVDDTFEVDRAPEVTEGWLVLDARSPASREIVWFNGVDGNFLTGVARGQQNTTAKSHIEFASVEMNITSEDLEAALAINSNIPQTLKDVFGDSAEETTFAAQKGLVWTQDTGRLGSMTAGIVYIQGIRTVVGAVTENNFPASKDNYVDVNPSGILVFTPVNNGDAEPAKAVDDVRIALIVTDASNITDIQDIRETPYQHWERINAQTVGGYLPANIHQAYAYGVLGNTQYFTSSGTYTKPAGLKFVIVEMVGGGGGSGGCTATSSTQTASSSSGGGGGYSKKKISAADLAAPETVTVGAGGTAAAAGLNNGGSGGTSSFGSHLSATGGGGGVAGNVLNNTDGQSLAGGAGGVGSGGDINFEGGDGAHRINHLTRARGGAGGTSFFAGLQESIGGGSNNATNAAVAGKLYGGGAAGTSNSGTQTANPGAAGAAGIVIVHEYF